MLTVGTANMHLYVVFCSYSIRNDPHFMHFILPSYVYELLFSALHGLGEMLSLGRDQWALILSGLIFQAPLYKKSWWKG